jgi:steroid 5-alpha reductase family enzyme
MPDLVLLHALALLVSIFAAMSVAMIVGWACQRAWNNGGWTDAFWSFSVGIVGVAASLAPLGGTTAPSLRQLLVAGLVGVWSLRLGTHIAARAGEGPEDARYAALRREWGADFQKRMFSFLQTQAAAGGFLVVTIALAAHNPSPELRAADLIAAGLFLLSVTGAGAADRQLAAFRKNPANRGRVCDAGLWAVSRHPNYFFEWLGWVAYAVIAVDLGGDYWVGWLSLSGPAFIYYLLRHVSGVPLLEAAMLRSRGAAYADYQARVSAFFPWPPRRSPSSDGAE